MLTGNGKVCTKQAQEQQPKQVPNSERFTLRIDHKQRAIQFAECHGESLIVRRTVQSNQRTHIPVRIREVLLTMPDKGDPLVLFTWTKRKPEPNWLHVWARAIEVLGPLPNPDQ